MQSFDESSISLTFEKGPGASLINTFAAKLD